MTTTWRSAVKGTNKEASFGDRLGQAATYGIPSAVLGGLLAGGTGYGLAPDVKMPGRAVMEQVNPQAVAQHDATNIFNRLLVGGAAGGAGALGLGTLGALYGFAKKPESEKKKKETDKEARFGGWL